MYRRIEYPIQGKNEILALNAKLESFTKKQKSEKNEKRNHKFEWKKVAHTNVLDTKANNDKTYNRYTKQRIWTVHKASECKLDSPKERKPIKKKKMTKVYY